MKIIFDARWTRLDTHDGISRYGANLVGALAKLHPVTMLVYSEQQLKLLPKGVSYEIVNHPFSPKELFLARRLNRLGADVVFSPLQIMGSFGRRYKLILTLQDLTYYHFAKPPTHLPAPVRGLWWLFHKAYWPQKLALSAADHLATVSHTSKKLIQEANLTTLPIDVIYNAASKLTDKKLTNKPGKNLVYMGSFMPYKNVELLMRTLNELPDYHLHCTSRSTPEREAELLGLLKNPKQVTFWHGASDEQYAELLSKSQASLMMSRTEGYGLQIIEAMDQGVPVVCTDIEIFHEVGGEAVQYCGPDDHKAVAAAVRRLEDKTFRDEQVKKSLRRAAKFTWDDSAKELLAVMQRLVRQK